mmetsp:Transcript_4866/g.11613  ORF Transcript_4866/g.11613 Transcript_4866/m.11613 type:complete len:109 (-) Transcript_4866:104-430(-)
MAVKKHKTPSTHFGVLMCCWFLHEKLLVVVVFPPKVEGNNEERRSEEAKLLKEDWRLEMEERLPSSSSPMAQDANEFLPLDDLPRVPGDEYCRLMDMACCLCTITILR